MALWWPYGSAEQFGRRNTVQIARRVAQWDSKTRGPPSRGNRQSGFPEGELAASRRRSSQIQSGSVNPVRRTRARGREGSGWRAGLVRVWGFMTGVALPLMAIGPVQSRREDEVSDMLIPEMISRRLISDDLMMQGSWKREREQAGGQQLRLRGNWKLALTTQCIGNLHSSQ